MDCMFQTNARTAMKEAFDDLGDTAQRLLLRDLMNKRGYWETEVIPGAFTYGKHQLGLLLKNDRRLVDAAQQKDWVYGVFEEIIECDDATVRFDWKQLVDGIIDGNALVVEDAPQSDKTTVFAVAHVCAAAMGRPVIMQTSAGVTSTFVSKYKELLRVVNDTSYAKFVQTSEEEEVSFLLNSPRFCNLAGFDPSDALCCRTRRWTRICLCTTTSPP